VDAIQLLTPAGELRDGADLSLKVDAALCHDLYRRMALARRVDDEATALQRQGELGLWCRSLGQEAAQVGSITAVQQSDHVFPTFREHAAALSRGVTPGELLALWRGLTHGGWDPARHRFHLYTLSLGSQLLHATGYAMGVVRDGAAEVVLAYFGDGAASQGDASEAFNWAATLGVPVIFFCQNNQWAISTPTSQQTRAPLHQRGRGFGLETYLVDGNDVLAVHAVTGQAADAIRQGAGPVLIEAVTYRMAGHSTADDPTRYRSRGEVDDWQTRDPLDRLRRLIERQDWAGPEFLAEVAAEADELAAETRRACLAMSRPDTAEMFHHVYAEGSPLIDRERDAYLTYLAETDPVAAD
jgi:pyruvate dehydrogenase E1 component alpha subunit